jgi:hypothetical protein
VNDAFLLIRAGITADYITLEQATRLYEDARDHPESGLDGELETGFGFWSLSEDRTMRLVHCTVIPCVPIPTYRPDEHPADEQPIT